MWKELLKWVLMSLIPTDREKTISKQRHENHTERKVNQLPTGKINEWLKLLQKLLPGRNCTGFQFNLIFKWLDNQKEGRKKQWIQNFKDAVNSDFKFYIRSEIEKSKHKYLVKFTLNMYYAFYLGMIFKRASTNDEEYFVPFRKYVLSS